MSKEFLLNFVKAFLSIVAFFFVLMGIPFLVWYFFGGIAGLIVFFITAFSVSAFYIALLLET
jgi:hypothetical protein